MLIVNRMQLQPAAYTAWAVSVPTADRKEITNGSYWRQAAQRLSPGDEIRILDDGYSFCTNLLVIYSDKISNVRVATLSSVDLPSTAQANA